MISLHRILVGLTALALVPIWIGCTEQVDTSRIPITTSSKKARDLYVQGRDMQERLLFQQSKPVFEQAVETDSNFALGHLGLAFAQTSNKEFFESFNRAKELAANASEGERVLILATDAANSGDTQMQGEYLRTLIQLFPDDPRAHNQLGNYYFGQQKYTEAIAQLIRATKLDSTFIPPYNMLGYANRAIGNYEQAEIAFQRYIKLLPDDPNPYDSYAELLLKMGRFEESIENYRKALKIRPDFVFSFVGIATDLTLMDKGEEARATLDEMLAQAKNDGQRRNALFAKAVTFVHEGNYEAALEMLTKQFELAQKIEDHSAMAQDLTNMGSVNFEAGDIDKALALYVSANEMIQSSALSDEIKTNSSRLLLYNQARCAAMKGEFDAATKAADEFTQQVNAIGNINQMRLAVEVTGLIALQQGNFEAAVAALEMGNKQNAKTLYQLALAYKGLGNMDKVREYCEQAANFNGLNDLNYAFIRNKAKALLAEFPST